MRPTHRRLPGYWTVLVLAVPMAFTLSTAAVADTPTTFIDVTQQLGINITPTGDSRSDWGHGCAFVDYDGDGVLELYAVMGDGQANRFFKLQDNATYMNIAPDVGCADGLNGRGVVFADYDNDGDKDFFLANWEGPNRLYNNDGTGNFIDVAYEAGVNDVSEAHSAAWADYNNDGYLDLFVCVYGRATQLDANLLYESNGDGTFTERAAAAGVADADKPALACTWIDYDNDGDLDLYIAYDKYRRNTMYRNNGDGTFTDQAVASHTDLVFNAMGIAVGDYDNDGYFDMYVTNTEDGNGLLHNNGDGTFSNVAVALGVTVNRIGWGCAFLDYDNDGDDDLYVVNWAFSAGNSAAGNVFFRNDGGTFTEKTTELGVGNTGPSYALTVGDYNNDGYLDMFVNNQEAPSVLYENSAGSNKWIRIKTVGTVSNRDGIGARVRVTAGPLVQYKDVRSGSSYLSQLSPELDFGLAGRSTVDEVQVTWPSGIVDTWTNVEINHSYVANEGGSFHRVPVFITSFEGAVVGRKVELRWDIVADEAIAGFRVYRRVDGSAERVVSGDALIEPAARRYVDVSAEAGQRYGYALAVVQPDGSEVRSPIVAVGLAAERIALEQNAPNPFNPGTTIAFTLAEAGRAVLDVYDTGGHHVGRLLDGVRPAGRQTVSWDGRGPNGQLLGSGVYFYRLRAGGRVLTRKMILLK